jgi:hypothetical protein
LLCYLHYISALRRLEESEKTVTMLGGDRKAPPQVLAQRDFIKMEKDYYADVCVKWNFLLFFFGMVGFLIFVLYSVTHKIA